MKHYQVILRMNRRSIIAWSSGVSAYVLLMGLIFIAFGGAEALGDLAESYPEEILEAFTSDIASVQGFLEAEAGTFLPVVFGIYLIMGMAKYLAGAEEDGRLDHLLARPISRDAYYWHTLLAGGIGFAIIMAAATIGGVIGFAGEATGKELLGIAGMMFEQFLLGLVFLGLGGLLGAAFHRRGAANATGAGIVVTFFFLALASRVSADLDWMAWLTPLGYRFRSDLFDGDLDPAFLAVCVLLSTGTALAGWLIFRRKNLYA